MKRILAIVFISICFIQPVAGQSTTFPEFINPKYMFIDNGQIIVSDYPHIYLYSLEGFRFNKKIGGQGEGPEEVYIPQGNRNLKDRGLFISVTKDCITAASVGRVSYFNRDGSLRRLTKLLHSNINARFFYFNQKLLRLSPTRAGKLVVAIFDSNMENQKKIMQCDYWLNWGSEKKCNLFDRISDTLLVATLDKKIFITRGDQTDLNIKTFGLDGKHLFNIKHNSKRIGIPKSYTDEVNRHFQVKFKVGPDVPFFKNLLIPSFFPAVRNLYAAGNTLYAITYQVINGKTQVLKFSTKGTYLGSVLLPVKERSLEQLFPFSIYKQKLYQLEPIRKANILEK